MYGSLEKNAIFKPVILSQTEYKKQIKETDGLNDVFCTKHVLLK